MHPTPSWPERRDELVAKLAVRATQCPGLYPFCEAGEFLRVARDHAGHGDEAVCRLLERMWQNPEEALQLNSQSLIRQGKGWDRIPMGAKKKNHQADFDLRAGKRCGRPNQGDNLNKND